MCLIHPHARALKASLVRVQVVLTLSHGGHSNDRGIEGCLGGIPGMVMEGMEGKGRSEEEGGGRQKKRLT